MLIIGERINSSRQEIHRAIEQRDEGFIKQVALKQAEAGADYLDVNAGTFLKEEEELLPWLVKAVQKETALPCALDSPNPRAVARGLEVHRGTPLINSISLEEGRLSALLPLVKESGAPVVALAMDDRGIPQTAEERLRVAGLLIGRLREAGLNDEKIYLDPLVQPLAVDHQAGKTGLQAIGMIRAAYPRIHIISGLSNVSHGLPGRRLVNRTFLVLARAAGMDAAILDPCDPLLMAGLRAAELVIGEDDYCLGYIQAFREGKLQGAG